MSQDDENIEDNVLSELNSNDFKKIHEKAEKLGYADGVAKGSESVFQLGFDKGYADGFQTGFQLEKYRTFFETVSKSKHAPEELRDEAIKFEAMAIPDTTNSEHFQYTKHQNESIETISQKQKEYLEDRLQQFEANFPKTKILFSKKN